MRYYIIAGEASGDLHGSNLMRGLYAEDPEAVIRFWGGDMMDKVCRENTRLLGTTVPDDGQAGAGQVPAVSSDGQTEVPAPAAVSAERQAGASVPAVSAEGAGLVRHYKDGAVMGVSDVLKKAGKLLGNVADCKKDILTWKPDVVILIDYPGFNFKIAEFAHKHGIKVFYYIAPKTWASREGRNRKLKAFVDKLFIVFPFEIPYFESRGIDFIYKGNPLLDAVDASEGNAWSTPDGKPYIAILAGSRGGEIKRMMPVCMQVADQLHAMEEYKDWRFVIAGAPARSIEDYDTGGRNYVDVVFGNTHGVLRGARAAVINSGTASLEAALIGTPQVVCWSTSALTIFIARSILKVGSHIKYISLGNLIIDRLAFRELIQEDFNAAEVGAELRRLIEDEAYRSRMLGDYAEIRAALGGRGASRAVAASMFQSLNK